MQRKDPNKLWYWVVVASCMIGILPVFFLGKVGPLILGIPFWVVVSLVSTVILTVVTLMQLRFGWSIADSGTREPGSTADE